MVERKEVMKVLTENKFLTDEELEQLLDLCGRYRGERNSILIRFILFTGARGCEVLAVTKADLGQDCVSIQGAKKSNNRVAPLPADFLNELKTYAGSMTNQDQDRLFPVAIRTLRHIWYQFRPNRNKGVHALRHTFGVRLYNNCKDIHVVKNALGHKSLTNTQIYLDFVEGQKAMKIASRGMWSQKNKLNNWRKGSK